ncbi:MAG: FxLYD domain-containing protein [Betaproteobacteria bacterium]
MNGFARRVVQGFAFGLGFSAAAAIAWFAVQEMGGLAREIGGTVSTAAPAGPTLQSFAPGPVAKVRVVEQRVERRHGDAVVFGVLRNEAETTVRSVRVEAAFYDGAGKLVDLCGWYIAPSLAGGEDKPFKVACGGTPERPSPDSASVRVRIVEAY